MVDIIKTRLPYAPDSNYSSKQIDNLTPSGSLLVSEMFYTIQGEGPYAGVSAVFVRLAGCNRGVKTGGAFCSGCDAAFEVHKATSMSFNEIYARINLMICDVVSADKPLIVITGGEPMIHTNLIAFIQDGRPKYRFQIESNGDFYLEGLQRIKSDVLIVVSPKIGNDGYGPVKAKTHSFVNVFKFLISGNPSSSYYAYPEGIITDLQSKADRIIYLSPIAYYNRGLEEGEVASIWDHTLIDREETSKSYARAATLVMEHPSLKLSVQTHLLLSKP